MGSAVKHVPNGLRGDKPRLLARRRLVSLNVHGAVALMFGVWRSPDLKTSGTIRAGTRG